MDKMINDADFALFRALMLSASGIDLLPTKKQLVTSRLQRRLRACGMDSFSAYYKLVTSREGVEEYERMLDLLTTHETYFFREPRHFDYLVSHILPGLNGPGTLRFWSAASSTGEEAYSLAMILSDKFRGPAQWEVVGSDISHDVIRRAREGVYPAARLENIPKAYIGRYLEVFDNQGERYVRVDARLKSKVRFMKGNLNEPISGLGSFDVVFLRNVLIYFDNDHKRAIVERVGRQMKPGAWLLIGHAETLNGLGTPFDQVVPTVYRKR